MLTILELEVGDTFYSHDIAYIITEKKDGFINTRPLTVMEELGLTIDLPITEDCFCSTNDPKIIMGYWYSTSRKHAHKRKIIMSPEQVTIWEHDYETTMSFEKIKELYFKHRNDADPPEDVKVVVENARVSIPSSYITAIARALKRKGWEKEKENEC